ncbi:MAG TPA: response regulator [Verrucomicrobiae bacterium]|nr:response regulator [Verrucomicrobiae bacterium]
MIDSGAKSSGLILAIDDEPTFLEILREALESFGYRVHVETDPSRAIAFYQEAWTDVSMVLLDFLMPRIPGDEVFAELQRINPDVRVVMLSGCRDSAIEPLREKGLRGWIRKPFIPPDLAQIVRDTIRDSAAPRVIDPVPRS